MNFVNHGATQSGTNPIAQLDGNEELPNESRILNKPLVSDDDLRQPLFTENDLKQPLFTEEDLNQPLFTEDDLRQPLFGDYDYLYDDIIVDENYYDHL